VTGVLQTLPGREAVVTPAVGGVLDGLFVHYGQSVARGVPVAHITSQQAMGQIQQAEATLGQNKVQVAQAQANAIQQRAQTASSIFQAQANVRIAQAALAGAGVILTYGMKALSCIFDKDF
jgi:multidrug efflux pump subunit AcrA (membrane-fusion protein)